MTATPTHTVTPTVTPTASPVTLGWVGTTDADGFYQIAHHTAAGWQHPQDWTASSALNQGEASNHLMVVRRGTQIAVYASGADLITVTDSSVTSGRVGLLARTFDEANADARFDNFRAYRLGSSGLAGETESATENAEPDSAGMLEPPPKGRP